MNVYPIEDTYLDTPTVVALGNFDGVHRGHQTLLNETVRVAHREDFIPLVYTFSEHPANILAKRFVVPYITTNEERLQLFEEIGIQATVLDPFKTALASLSPVDFFNEILLKRLNAKHIVCGFHYHFGSHGAGDARMLEKLCKEHGIGISVLPPFKKLDTVISSTWVRTCIDRGEVDKAMELMGHPFTLSGTVEHGKALGRTLGVPTINQMFPEEKIKPTRGVYYTKVKIGSKLYKGATNVGIRPTVQGTFLNSETHILDFQGDLYGETIVIYFIKHIREEYQFENAQQLQTQLLHDIETLRSI